jgi:hypothetical protein
VTGITVTAILESHGLCILAEQQLMTKESSIVELADRDLDIAAGA